MQSIMIATTNTQKSILHAIYYDSNYLYPKIPTPDLIFSLTSKTLLKSNYIKSYTGIFQKHGKTIQIFHTLYSVLNVSRY